MSGRQMLTALIGGQRSPSVLAQMARGSMHTKVSVLEEALTGHFADERAFLCRLKVEGIADPTAKVDQVSAPPAH